MDRQYIQVSAANPRYFETTDGKPFIPNGPNMSFPRSAREPAEVVDYYRDTVTALAEAGGNFIRIWLGAPCFEIESKAEGQFEEQELRNIEQVVRICEETGVRIKFTLEHFRTLEPRQEVESFPGVASFVKDVYHTSRGGSLTSIAEFLTTPAGEAVYKRRLGALAERFSDSPAIMAWELWNEVNCTGPMEHWAPWSERMLWELKKRFPHHLTVQSLGSFCSLRHHMFYDWLGQLPGNDFYQAHRYLDLGAAFDVCRGPMDVLCADTICELRSRNVKTPVILAEGGAVEPNHTGPSHLYAADTQGMLLHDVLFAPFFAGSAAAGQCWHWEKYIARNNLWWHFGRFAKAVAGIDPRTENYQPFQRESRSLRYYGLRGKTHTLVWCRDKCNTWATELDNQQAPETLSAERLDVSVFSPSAVRRASFYNPWSDTEGTLDLVGTQLLLPDFERSLVLRLDTHE